MTLISRVMMPKLVLHLILLLVVRDRQQPTMSAVPRQYIDIIDVIGER